MATKAKVDNEPRRWFIRYCRPSYFCQKDGKVTYWATIESKIMDAPEPTWMVHKFLFDARPKTGPGILRRVVRSGDMTACQVFERVCESVKGQDGVYYEPCRQCGREDLPLHTDYRCPNCHGESRIGQD